MKNTCDICGNFAGFDVSPEGETCFLCDRWVCYEHVHFSDDDDPIPLCKDCYIHCQIKAGLYGEHYVYVG